MKAVYDKSFGWMGGITAIFGMFCFGLLLIGGFDYKRDTELLLSAIGCLGIGMHIWCLFCRDIELTQEGCAIRWMFIKRFYRWNQIEHIRWYPYSPKRKAKLHYDGGILISTKKKHISNWDEILVISSLHPFSSFCVHFSPDKGKTEVSIGEVDKTAFMELMKQIGVNVSHLQIEE